MLFREFFKTFDAQRNAGFGAVPDLLQMEGSAVAAARQRGAATHVQADAGVGGQRRRQRRAGRARPALAAALPAGAAPGAHVAAGALLARCGDGGTLHLQQVWDSTEPGVALRIERLEELARTQP